MSQNSTKRWFNLEEQFFNQVDNALLEKLRGQMSVEQTAEQIAQVTGIADKQLAQEIAKLDVTVETLSAFRLTPLVAVAWADDRIEENERYAIIRSAEKAGIQAEDPAMQLLESWTKRRPSEELLNAWCDYTTALIASLNDEHRVTLKKEIMKSVESVAEASGGVLGFGSVSPSEKAVIARIEAALS
ncbi:MAG: hypothetical protein R3C53_07365 [Pirellulaceae bacterium]